MCFNATQVRALRFVPRLDPGICRRRLGCGIELCPKMVEAKEPLRAKRSSQVIACFPVVLQSPFPAYRSFFENQDERYRFLLKSPYRCNDCGIRLWAVSGKVRRIIVWVSVLLIMSASLGWLISRDMQ